MVYDPLRRVIIVRDALGRTISQQWCACGSLEAIVDSKGQTTRYAFDLEGRRIRETFADGVTATTFAYETRTSRLKTVTDPKGQVTTYSYNLDDSQQLVVYTNTTVVTPSVGYTYDTAYNRLTAMMDGTGTTVYGYKPVGALGANSLASVDGPLTDDTVTYDYDELGRLRARAVSGSANQIIQSFDALGRVVTEVNSLGTFTYAYDGLTDSLASVTYPNGQTSTYDYYGNSGDRRLLTLHHKYPGGGTLSKFDYTYDAAGNVKSWQQQADSASPVNWAFSFDPGDELLTAVESTTGPTPTVLKRYAYAYDGVANRTVEQIDDAVTSFTYDTMNRLMGEQPGGLLRVVGTVNEPAGVSVGGRQASVTPDNQFSGTVPVVQGANTFSVIAVDPSGNIRTQSYTIDSSGPSKSMAYDANGNLLSDGVRTMEWDARNQLVAVTVGTHRSEFTYDGEQHRVRRVEKDGLVVQSDTRVLWCGTAICEERAADGIVVMRRTFGLGEEVAGQVSYFTTDHLENVREVTNGLGSVQARYSFDPWGRRSVVSGTDVTNVGFTGLRAHGPSALALAMYRAYDADLARWLSRDPLGDVDGLNRSAYAGNNPIGRRDVLGLQWSWLMPGTKNETKQAIEDVWTRCLNKGDRRVYWRDTNFNPIVNWGQWLEWKKNFNVTCRKYAWPGHTRYSTCVPGVMSYYSKGPSGFCVCCESCTPQ